MWYEVQIFLLWRWQGLSTQPLACELLLSPGTWVPQALSSSVHVLAQLKLPDGFLWFCLFCVSESSPFGFQKKAKIFPDCSFLSSSQTSSPKTQNISVASNVEVNRCSFCLTSFP